MFYILWTSIWLIFAHGILLNFLRDLFPGIMPFFIAHDAMALWLRRWILNPGVPNSKPLGVFKVNSAFHPSEVD